LRLAKKTSVLQPSLTLNQRIGV
jgi:hypothetical protein